MNALSELHRATPVLSVIEPRGLPVRTVRYHRRVEDQPLEQRVDRQAYDALGRLVAQWDPRLWALVEDGALAPANQTSVHDLTGQVLAQDSVDAGWRLALLGDAGQVAHRWDSRGTQVSVEYDRSLRPVAVFEQGQGEPQRCAERLTYAGPEASAKNLCGQLDRHDDPAGSLQILEADLNGNPLVQSRHFLLQETLPDWPLERSLRDELLESAHNASTTQHFYNALGDVQGQTDAKGNHQRFTYSVDGRLHGAWLQLAGQAEQVLLSMIHYNAFAQVEKEFAGNGAVTAADYSPVDGRLMHLRVHRADNTCLQDLRYSYDPVGNILGIRDEAQPTRFSNNQRIEPLDTYRYDTLYQLIEATGREIGPGQQGPALPALQPTPIDPNQLSRFTQTYCYDAGNNLTSLRHVGAQSYTREMQVASLSNRSVAKEIELATAFDANGNLLLLQPGQGLSWDLRNQLRCVTPVERLEAANDDEVYHYDGSGQRVRKIRHSQARNVSHRAEVRYLPGLELRTDTATGESLQVICVSAGRSNVRVLHWDAGQPDSMSNDQLRYSISDHLGSSGIELDQQARLLSQEGYYPYGGTAWWAGRNAIEAKYKTVRYSGKERDPTGLNYYGFRYYAPWLGRWINPDPAPGIDGLNRFTMVRNNPITLIDQDGLAPIYPVLGAFLNDVFHDPGYARMGSYPLAPGESADYAPIAIWDKRIHVGTAGRHMGIRPASETGFPDFVGEITGREITNKSGHYRPPAGLGKLIPQGYVYKEEHTDASDAFIRLTMFSSPEDYVKKVAEFRTLGSEQNKAKGILGFLQVHGLHEQASLAAYTYQNVHITALFRAGGADIEPGFEEIFSSMKAEATRLQTANYWSGTSKGAKESAARMQALNMKLNAMDALRADDSTVSRGPYSAVRELIESARPARRSSRVGSANQANLMFTPPHRKSGLLSWLSSRMRR